MKDKLREQQPMIRRRLPASFWKYSNIPDELKMTKCNKTNNKYHRQRVQQRRQIEHPTMFNQQESSQYEDHSNHQQIFITDGRDEVCWNTRRQNERIYGVIEEIQQNDHSQLMQQQPQIPQSHFDYNSYYNRQNGNNEGFGSFYHHDMSSVPTTGDENHQSSYFWTDIQHNDRRSNYCPTESSSIATSGNYIMNEWPHKLSTAASQSSVSSSLMTTFSDNDSNLQQMFYPHSHLQTNTNDISSGDQTSFSTVDDGSHPAWQNYVAAGMRAAAAVDACMMYAAVNNYCGSNDSNSGNNNTTSTQQSNYENNMIEQTTSDEQSVNRNQSQLPFRPYYRPYAEDSPVLVNISNPSVRSDSLMNQTEFVDDMSHQLIRQLHPLPQNVAIQQGSSELIPLPP